MDLTQWYAVSVAAIFGCILIYRVGTLGTAYFVSRFQQAALHYFVYPLLIRRRYWTSVSRLHGSLLGSYFVINGFCMGLGIRSASDLMSRSGVMASINLIPLFLGGRTNLMANFLGVSLHTYYLAHHWIGRVVIIQGLLHAALVIAAKVPWTFDSSQVSGISSVSALALIFLLSMHFIRRIIYEIFLKVHLILSMIVVIALLKHLQSKGLAKSIFPVIALSLWGFNACLRAARMIYYNLGGARNHRTGQATITHFSKKPGEAVTAMRLTVQLRRPLEIRPGQYLYLFLSDLGSRSRFEAHPYIITWWDDSLSAMTLSFLIQPQGGLSNALAYRNSLRSVIIDGPYGKDLMLEDYENVILTANGIGIAGILPYIRHMTYRRLSKRKDHEAYRRGLITRKVDVLWVMEDNSQIDWITEWILQLKEKDSEKLFLTFTCFYPHRKTKDPPIVNDDYWRFIDDKKPIPSMQDLINKRIRRSAGKTKVVVCGTAMFSTSVREIVLNSMSEHKFVEFAEVEFRPNGMRQGFPGVRSPAQDNLEMDQLSPSLMEARLGRLVRLSKSRLSVSRKSSLRDDGRMHLVEAKEIV